MGTPDLPTDRRGAQRTIAVVLPFLVAAGLAAVGDRLATAASVLVLVLVVVAVGAAGDRVAGVLAAVSGGLWFDFFLTVPAHRFAIRDSDDVEVVVLLVAVGVAVTEIASWGLRQQAAAARRAGFLDGVLESADIVAGADVDPGDVRRRVAERITSVLELDGCRSLDEPPPLQGVALLLRDGAVERDGVAISVQREGLPTDVETCIPVPGPGGGTGHFRLTAATRVLRPTREQRRVAVLLADQCARIDLPGSRIDATLSGSAGLPTEHPVG